MGLGNITLQAVGLFRLALIAGGAHSRQQRHGLMDTIQDFQIGLNTQSVKTKWQIGGCLGDTKTIWIFEFATI
jgi:hypothetical protein